MQKNVLLPRRAIYDFDFSQIEGRTKREGRDTITYLNIPVSYDIETSSFYNEHGQKTVITYSHALNIDGYCFKMETWGEFQATLEFIAMMAQLHHSNKRIIIYIHNLEYEFQFMKHHFEWVKVFNNGGESKPLKALTKSGIEFRCSRMLYGGRLENMANSLVIHKIQKLKGDLDHDIIHTPITPLTDEEEGYILNDVVIIEYYIREAMHEAGGDITKIPLTKTGYVRELARERTIIGKTKEVKRYRDLISELTMEPDEYEAARLAFSGGFTHANIATVKTTRKDVVARDLASSYPAVLVGFKYPMSKGEVYEVRNKKDFFKQIRSYCCLFYIEFKGLVRTANEGYISSSKAVHSTKVKTNNGRVETAATLKMWMTEVDFDCVMQSYEVEDFRIIHLWRYKAGYLPTPLVELAVELYKKKTELKKVKGKEIEYNRSKENLNSIFGMCVQDPRKEEFEWDDVTKTASRNMPSVDDAIGRYNKSRRRFLSYLWGVWITAYGRYMTFPVVVALGVDYDYTDTDSVYYENDDKNEHLFEESNRNTEERMRLACEHHGIDYSELCPIDPDGNVRPLGAWEMDGEYAEFKTLGAKRYIVKKLNSETGEYEYNITVSGVNKSVAVPYLLHGDINEDGTYDDGAFRGYGEDGIFDAFDENLEIPEGKAGKMTHSYINDPRSGVVRDYLGNEYEYYERSGVHLEHTTYKMTMSDEYKEMIEEVQQLGLAEKAKQKASKLCLETSVL